jgi:CO/xanthine dehydrogenase Mo-binding subunit
MYSEGFDDFATARCRLADGGVALKFATAEVGQGFVTLAPQIARSTLGVDRVVCKPIDTTIGSAGSTSASRQTWMSGGAVLGACRAVADQVVAHVATQWGVGAADVTLSDGELLGPRGLRTSVAEVSAGRVFEATFEHHHPPTEDLDEDGQGNCHTAFAFVAHRAVSTGARSRRRPFRPCRPRWPRASAHRRSASRH